MKLRKWKELIHVHVTWYKSKTLDNRIHMPLDRHWKIVKLLNVQCMSCELTQPKWCLIPELSASSSDSLKLLHSLSDAPTECLKFWHSLCDCRLSKTWSNHKMDGRYVWEMGKHPTDNFCRNCYYCPGHLWMLLHSMYERIDTEMNYYCTNETTIVLSACLHSWWVWEAWDEGPGVGRYENEDEYEEWVQFSE